MYKHYSHKKKNIYACVQTSFLDSWYCVLYPYWHTQDFFKLEVQHFLIVKQFKQF